jgi:hypothetical protein
LETFERKLDTENERVTKSLIAVVSLFSANGGLVLSGDENVYHPAYSVDVSQEEIYTGLANSSKVVRLFSRFYDIVGDEVVLRIEQLLLVSVDSFFVFTVNGNSNYTRTHVLVNCGSIEVNYFSVTRILLVPER